MNNAMKPGLHDPSTAPIQAASKLREASVRVTAARVNVLAVLLDAPRAFSHQEMQESLASMDRVTLYRALDCLVDAGLAHKIAGDDRVFRYSAGGETAHAPSSQHAHVHFKCTRCAKVFCVDDGDEAATSSPALDAAQRAALLRQMEGALRRSLGPGFQGHDIELSIKGWCADCVN